MKLKAGISSSPCREVSEREFLELAVSCLWNAACGVAAVKLEAWISSSPCREVSEIVLVVGCVMFVE